MDQEKDGFPITSIREVAILSALKQLGNSSDHQLRSSLCENIVLLKEVVTGYKPESIFLVFEYCSIDLAELIFNYQVNAKFKRSQ